MRFALVTASFLFSLAGTVVAASVQNSGGASLAQTVAALGVGWGPAFGCSIAAAVLQFAAWLLAVADACVGKGGGALEPPLARGAA